jgi:hypothetical protein
MRAQFEREAENPDPWTSYNPSLTRPLLNSRRFLEDTERAEEPDPAPPAQAAAAASSSRVDLPLASEKKQ